MRLAPEKPWLPFQARQHFTTCPPAFEWNARVSILGLPLMTVRDSLRNGEANMRGTFAGIVPVVKAHGTELNQGGLLRYLGEIGWFPMTARSEYIRWKEVDDRTARACMSLEDFEVCSTWEFGEEGLPIRFSAKRYAARGKGFELLDWWVVYTGYAVFDGVTVGSQCEVYWRYPEGEFCWMKLEVIQLEFK